ncbi:MAG: hypothetical protein ACI9TH_000313 [Kiritimatiellia bacterium]|jgi:hypothetical protein
MRIYAFSLFALCLIPFSLPAYEWTDLAGKAIEAEYVKREGNIVWLKPVKKPVVKIPYTSLIQDDREFIDGMEAQAALQSGRQPSKNRRAAALPSTPSSTQPDHGQILRDMVAKRDAEAAEKQRKLEAAKAAFNKKKAEREAKSKKKGGKKKKKK